MACGAPLACVALRAAAARDALRANRSTRVAGESFAARPAVGRRDRDYEGLAVLDEALAVADEFYVG
jgi:hypothetical protein